MFFTVSTYAQKAGDNAMRWKTAAELPPLNGQAKSLGFAGPVTGITGNKLIIAGGANFPDSMPWLGGKKKYYDEVYILQKRAGNKFSWLVTKPLHLKQKLAYSGNITTPDGIVCVGGETDTGHTREVFLLRWDDVKKDIIIKELPSLPVGLANTAVTNTGKTIYVAGGEDGQKASDAFFELDMSVPSPQWKVLLALPIAMSHSVAVTQSNGENQCVYVIGGRTKAASGLSDLHNTVFCYNPKKNSWKQLSSISDGQETTNMSAATAVAFGETCILLMGGDKGNIFHKIETFNINIAAAKTTEEKERLQAEKIQLLNNHPGFSRDVLAYNTAKDCWEKIGELPGFGPVTTTAVKWNDEIFIPSGEIKPGVRTPQILKAKFR
ncbi:MAG: kelch repeat-containing protein [Chitinophagaceae bacterium]